jgi:hypothetical protein
MTTRQAVRLLGMFIVAAPVLAVAQARPSGTRTGPIGVTLPSPPSRMGGRGSDHGRPDFGGRPIHRRFGTTWSYPIVVESPYASAVRVPVPYPVPYYVPMRVPSAALGSRSSAPLVPYDPAKARITMIGAGADGGGGVLHLEPLAGDTIEVTWRGTPRPVRSAEIFLADSLRRPLVKRAVSVENSVVRIALGGLARPAAFAGITVVFGDGSTTMTLVPFPARRD